MLIDPNKLVSISQVNQNFSKIMKLLEQKKSLFILKNNRPVYVLIDFKELEKDDLLKKYIEQIR